MRELRIKRITPTYGFTLRELRRLRRDYQKAHEHPLTRAEIEALPNPFAEANQAPDALDGGDADAGV